MEPLENSPSLVFASGEAIRATKQRPCNDERNGKADHDGEHNQSHGPIRYFKKWKNLRRDLDQQPAYDGVGRRDFVNVAPFQFRKKVVDLHFNFGATTFCTRA